MLNLGANKRYYDIEGAPLKIKDNVTILNNPSDDDTFDEKHVGMTGIVIYFEYNCGCGQTFPADPMIGVQFSTGDIEEFWQEELLLNL